MQWKGTLFGRKFFFIRILSKNIWSETIKTLYLQSTKVRIAAKKSTGFWWKRFYCVDYYFAMGYSFSSNITKKG